MSAPFDFEAFISGLTVDLPREQVPLYTVIHQSRIDDLDAQIEAASDPDAPGADEREASSGATALVRERDALVKEQDESAHWITLRCLTTQEFADEVQAGMARTGRMFGFDHSGVVPDLVTMAKGLAGGFPLSAVTGRAELMDAVHGGGLGGTYGGNPVACAAALASMDFMAEHDLAGRARAIGERLTGRLTSMAERFPQIGEVRGRGAMIAAELVTDRETKEPAAALAGAVNKACHERGLVTLTCGTLGNVFRFLPPLTITDELLDEGLDVFEEAFAASV